MKLGLGLGLNRRRRVGGAPPPAFTPADLFTASEGGFWGQARTSDLWQDVARTTPVTAAGQTVASWRLYTASGVRYAEQSTGARQPTYQVDANGRGYISFDGTDDCLVVAGLNMTASDELTVMAVHRRLDTSTFANVMLEFSPAGDANNGGFFIRAPWSSPYVMWFRGSVVSQLGITDSTAPVSRVLTILAKISTDELSARLDGVAAGSSATDMGTGTWGNWNLTIGRRNDVDLPWDGWMYGLVMRGALTSGTPLTNVEAWGTALLNP
jgi:hypothetical protein